MAPTPSEVTSNSLVVQDDVRPPDSVVRKTYSGDAAEVGGVPGEVGVVPGLVQPAVHRDDLEIIGIQLTIDIAVTLIRIH